MNRKLLRNDQWEGIKDLLPGKKGDPGKTGGDKRLLIEAVLWIARTGSPWRDLLPAFGNWHSVYRRHSPWGKKGVWKLLLEHPDHSLRRGNSGQLDHHARQKVTTL